MKTLSIDNLPDTVPASMIERARELEGRLQTVLVPYHQPKVTAEDDDGSVAFDWYAASGSLTLWIETDGSICSLRAWSNGEPGINLEVMLDDVKDPTDEKLVEQWRLFLGENNSDKV